MRWMNLTTVEATFKKKAGKYYHHRAAGLLLSTSSTATKILQSLKTNKIIEFRWMNLTTIEVTSKKRESTKHYQTHHHAAGLP